ncbi:igl (predicted) [Pycnogonum litorale]
MGCHVTKESKENILGDNVPDNDTKNYEANDTKINNVVEQSELSNHKCVNKDTKLKDNELSDKNKCENHRTSENSAVDIDLEDPEVKKAATKIQATFRGHMSRKNVSQQNNQGHSEPDTNNQVTEDNSDILDLDPNDGKVIDAVTKIQAGFRGIKARKFVKELTDEQSRTAEKQTTVESLQEEVLDIDLTDPDLTKAASKIQATFRGHRAKAAKEDS